MLVAIGWWPPDIPFGTRDLLTTIRVLEKQSEASRRPR